LSEQIPSENKNKDQINPDLEISRLLKEAKKLGEDSDELMPSTRRREIKVHLNTSPWPPLTRTKEAGPKILRSYLDEIEENLKHSEENARKRRAQQIADIANLKALEKEWDHRNTTAFGFSAPWVIALLAVILFGVVSLVYVIADQKLYLSMGFIV
jgi:hypothetical protein